MGIRTLLNNKTTAVAAGATVLAVLAGGVGFAAERITSSDIKNNTIRSADVKDNTLKLKDLSAWTKRQLKSQEEPYVGPHWSIVDRNVIGNGDSYLRSGPGGEPPGGIGSLGIRTGSGTDKAAFGNEVDFAGDPLADLTEVSYFVYTTGENNDPNPENGPNVTFEVDPTGTGDSTAPNYTSLVYVPTALTANDWTELDASTAQRWYMTGAAGTAAGCTQASYCTLEKVKSEFPNATLLTAQITKGRDAAFSGAVDMLTIGSTTYDFEPLGVTATTR